jgi:hypothetical protein
VQGVCLEQPKLVNFECSLVKVVKRYKLRMLELIKNDIIIYI